MYNIEQNAKLKREYFEFHLYKIQKEFKLIYGNEGKFLWGWERRRFFWEQIIPFSALYSGYMDRSFCENYLINVLFSYVVILEKTQNYLKGYNYIYTFSIFIYIYRY